MRLIVAALNTQPRSLLERSGFVAQLGTHGVAPSLGAAMEAAALACAAAPATMRAP